MDGISITRLTIGQHPHLEGLEPVADPVREVGHGNWILGAWYFGHGTEYHEDGILAGRDWLAVVWRDPDGRPRSFGRMRDHREYLGIEDDKTFYTTHVDDETEVVRIYGRAAERLARDWGVEPHAAFDLVGERLLDWFRSLPDVDVKVG